MNKLCMAIGHKESSQGAVNKDSGVTEWGWDSEFVLDIGTDLFDRDWGCVVGNETLGSWINKNVCYQIFYRTSTITDLVKRINAWNPDLCIEFHCNSYKEKWLAKFMKFEKEATGTEMLLSKKYKYRKGMDEDDHQFAVRCMDLSFGISKAFPVTSRVIFPKDAWLIRTNKYRGRWHPKGGYFLNKTRCKAIIAETFFIDNNSDLAKANENYDALVQAVVDWIVNYFKEV